MLAVETNKAFQYISNDSDWCIYIQGDEVLHEGYYDNIRTAMELHKDNPNVDGLLLAYHHFYGSYNYISIDPSSYKNEIRVIKNNKNIYSYLDAQGFRKDNNKKLSVIPVDAFVFHYSKVKEPGLLQRKHEDCMKYWYDDEWLKKNLTKEASYNFIKNRHVLTPFNGTHPDVMTKRLESANWHFEYDETMGRLTLKQQLKKFIEEKLGYNLSYKNYVLAG